MKFEPVFACFGNCTFAFIDELFVRTFGTKPQASSNCRNHCLTNGSEIAVCQMVNGRDRFLELFEDSEDCLARVSGEYALTLSECQSDQNQDGHQLEHWLEFRLSSSMEFYLEAYRELRTLKDNFLEMNTSIAYEFDNCEVTAGHPCGGTIGEFLF